MPDREVHDDREKTMELDEQVLAGEARSWWWVFLVLGLAWLMVGFVVLRLDTTSIATVGFLIGGLFVGGALNEAMIATASSGGWKILHWVMAVIFVFGAGWAFSTPGEPVFALASVLGLILFFQGTLTIMGALASRDVNAVWGLVLALGVLEILLAFWVSQRYIPARVALILVWVGIMAIFRGVEHIALAFAVRRARPATVTAS
jgi:uncharacterized membrane protein HdeD (DUF308 family)